MKNKIGETADLTMDKLVPRLKEPTKRAKQALRNMLEKNLKRLTDQVEQIISEEKKSALLKKKERVSKDLDVLKVLKDDEIIRFALLMSNKIMSLASNIRVPREERMKARVAAHKPLSTHLRKLNQKLTKAKEPKSGSESEDEQESGGSTLNKFTFNNKIVSMRKDVRRAKVHVIHKLTRNIKKLREIKGEEDKIAKFQNKAERLHKKVVHIKELHEDEISKFALSTTQNVNQLAFDIKAPTISQALATVAIYKYVAAHVSSFKSQYPEWEKIVPNLLKKKRKKRKLNLETKDRKESSELLQSNAESDGENSGSEASEDSESASEVSDDENNADSGSSENGEEEESEDDINRMSMEEKDEDESESDEEMSETSLKKVVQQKRKHLKEPDKVTDSSSLKTKQASNASKSKKLINNANLSSTHVKPKPVENLTKVVDPFFMTTTNQEYETSQVPLSNENTSSYKKSGFEEKHFRKFDNIDSDRKWERTNNDRKFSKMANTAPYTKSNPSPSNKYPAGTKREKIVFGNRKERRKALLQPPVEEKVEKLHPSWEAKKKQSAIIPFQGKKVTFD
ncbi:serum response factor-binding protein 1 [Macrosteles quadrilineatus]|uniref:serum response factor-binding protein 1 n=1 Tax=Macrosteles quadrilineatus TaxID=74068 RepID=UPI0023E26207|nr:serum response factor-binding protein 1 [Macrosteles quadrilineatus]